MAAAREGQRAWIGMSAAARGRAMMAVAASVRRHADALAELETLSAGKPIRDTKGEVAKVAEMFEYYAGWCDKLHGEVIPVPTSHLNYTGTSPSARWCRSPLGTRRSSRRAGRSRRPSAPATPWC